MMKKNYIYPTVKVKVIESEAMLAASGEIQISDKTTSTGGEDGAPITSGDAKDAHFSVWDE